MYIRQAAKGFNTSGAPVAFDRVRVKVNDEMYTLCDGKYEFSKEF